MRSKFCSSGGCGARTSAPRAMTTIASATTAPTTTTVLRVTRRSAFVFPPSQGRSVGGRPGGVNPQAPGGVTDDFANVDGAALAPRDAVVSRVAATPAADTGRRANGCEPKRRRSMRKGLRSTPLVLALLMLVTLAQ